MNMASPFDIPDDVSQAAAPLPAEQSYPDLMRQALQYGGQQGSAPRVLDPMSHGMRDTFDTVPMPGQGPNSLLAQAFGISPAAAQSRGMPQPKNAGIAASRSDPLVRQLQQRFNALGMRVPIDGRIDSGGPTAQAVEVYAKQNGIAPNPLAVLEHLDSISPESRARQHQADQMKLQEGLAKATAEAARDNKATAVTNATTQAAQDANGWHNLILDILPPLAGIGLGMAGRHGVGKGLDKLRASWARRGDDVMADAVRAGNAPSVTATDAGKRIADVNQFYRDGGVKSPFASTTNEANGVFGRSRNVPPDAAYKEGLGTKTIREIAMPIVGGLEFGAGEYYERDARGRADAARQRYGQTGLAADAASAVSDDKTADIISKLKRFGIGTAVGGLGWGAKGGFSGDATATLKVSRVGKDGKAVTTTDARSTMPSPQSMAAADRERMAITSYQRNLPPPPPPPPSPAVQRLQNNRDVMDIVSRHVGQNARDIGGNQTLTRAHFNAMLKEAAARDPGVQRHTLESYLRGAGIGVGMPPKGNRAATFRVIPRVRGP